MLLLLQVLQLSQHDKAITIYYHPNSFSSTQSIRSNLASCWRFTVALDTPEVTYSCVQHQLADLFVCVLNVCTSCHCDVTAVSTVCSIASLVC